MSAPDVKSSFAESGKGKFLAAGLSAFLVLSPVGGFNNSAHAQQLGQKSNLIAEADDLLRAGNLAERYSVSEKGVGILISYGASDGLPSAKDIGDKFVKAFEDRGAKAKYFIVNSQIPGASMAFHIDKVSMGFFSLQDAASKVNQVVSVRKGADNIATLSY